MKEVPLIDADAQSFFTSLGGQQCRIELRQRSTGLYLDVRVEDTPIVLGVACRNLVRVVRDDYLGFIGDLVFFDTQGSNDPVSPGLGSRFLLQYLEPADLA